MTAFARSRPPHVAIVGSRHITDYRSFALAVRSLLAPWSVIVSGGAAGVDSLAARYARQNHHELIEHPVDLTQVAAKEREGLDRRAAYGIVACDRNSLIVRDSDRLIAFLCDHSKGTLDTIRKMRQKLDCPFGSVDTRVIVYLWPCGRS